MPCVIVRDDITRMRVDVIVNTTNRFLIPEGGGIATAIFRAAGPGLPKECEGLAPCEDGEVKVSGGHGLPCRYIFHTVTPAWRGGGQDEVTRLSACYTHALEEAVKRKCATIAIPLLSAGAHGFPTDLALTVANDAIRGFLTDRVPEDDLTVSLVIFTRESVFAGSRLFREIAEYIDDTYVAGHYDERRGRVRRSLPGSLSPDRPRETAGREDREINAPRFPEREERSIRSAGTEDRLPGRRVRDEETCYSEASSSPTAFASENLCTAREDVLDLTVDESFTEMLVRKLIEKDMPNTECYKRANIDKKLFSKICGKKDYQPKKTTAFALAVGLRLTPDETREFLEKAGYAISHSSKLDIIVEYFIKNGKYDVLAINEMLFAYDLPLLGTNVG